jgi:hypothetical protein
MERALGASPGYSTWYQELALPIPCTSSSRASSPTNARQISQPSPQIASLRAKSKRASKSPLNRQIFEP